MTLICHFQTAVSVPPHRLPQRGISMKKTELTCIRCPIGCAITVTQDDDGKVTDITGNSCPNGYKYAANEVTNPTRIVTTTVRVKDRKSVV